MMHADISPSVAYPKPTMFIVSSSSRKYLHTLNFGVFLFCLIVLLTHCVWFFLILIIYSIFFKFFTACVTFSHCSQVMREFILISFSVLPVHVPQIHHLYLYLVFEQQPQVWIAHLALVIFTACRPVIFFYSTFWLLQVLAGLGEAKGGLWRQLALARLFSTARHHGLYIHGRKRKEHTGLITAPYFDFSLIH